MIALRPIVGGSTVNIFADGVGYLAALLVLMTFWMRTMVPLRYMGIASNVLFMTYGYLAAAYPPLVLHVLLLPLNVVRLREMLRLTRQADSAAQSDLSMDWLKPFASTVRFRSGDVLFRKGDKAKTMFFVVSGRYRLTEIAIDVLPGSLVGELGFLAPDQKRTQTLMCEESGEILEITYDELKQLYFQNPEFGFYFLRLTTQRLFQNNARLQEELTLERSKSPQSGS